MFQPKISTLVFLISWMMLLACDGNVTNFYEDPNNKGLSIFSNTTNNIAAAYFNDEIWRTRDRVYSVISYPSNELIIQKEITTTVSDTLIFQWTGNYVGKPNSVILSYVMAIPKNFRAADLVTFKGKRFNADGISGYFKVSGTSAPSTEKGSGTIYFHTAEIQLNQNADGNGKIAGLFEASFNSIKITKGRFDHYLNTTNVRLP